MIPGGAVAGGGEVYGVPEEGVGRAGLYRVGDVAGKGSWAPSPLPLGWRSSRLWLAPSAEPYFTKTSCAGPPELLLAAPEPDHDLFHVI